MDNFHIINKILLGKLHWKMFYALNIEIDGILRDGCQIL